MRMKIMKVIKNKNNRKFEIKKIIYHLENEVTTTSIKITNSITNKIFVISFLIGLINHKANDIIDLKKIRRTKI